MLGTADADFMGKMLDLAAPLAEQPITFLHFTGLTPGDRAAGTAEQPMYTPPAGTSLPAIVTTPQLDVKDLVGGRVLIGDAVFQIRVSVLAVEPTTDDRIRWGGSTYEPIRVQGARVGGVLFWVVRCKKL